MKESYIRFEELPPKPKTKCWAVMNKDSNDKIGDISWYGPWRKYCFSPLPYTVFEQVCLRDIATFCETETAKHKAAKLKPINP